MKDEALSLLRQYRGGLVQAGADTFWELYDPSDPLLSPDPSVLVNSYRPAGSCPAACFPRGRKLG
jgi:hypothetical protein